MEKNVKTTASKAVKAVKSVATAPETTEAIDKVMATAKNVNAEIKATAAVIVEDVKEAAQDIKAVATKSVKEVSKKVDFSKSAKKVKSTAKSVNAQLADAASDITAEVKEKGKELKSATTKLAKEALQNADLSDRFNAIKKAAQNANDFALQTSDNLIDALVVNGEKWQNVADKAVKSGLKLADRQQNLMFNALEAAKNQFGGTATRFKKLLRSK
jgi:hypothetical protein